MTLGGIQHCLHPTSFGVAACCMSHKGEGRCNLVVYTPLELEEKTHGFSPESRAAMEKAATWAVQAVGGPILRAMIYGAIPFPLTHPPKVLTEKEKPNLIVLPKD